MSWIVQYAIGYREKQHFGFGQFTALLETESKFKHTAVAKTAVCRRKRAAERSVWAFGNLFLNSQQPYKMAL
jgi:hypothetical protein